jgi:hypothetical protein
MAPGSRPQSRVLVEKDVPMRTRDGVTLRANVYRPDASGRYRLRCRAWLWGDHAGHARALQL